MKRKYLTEEEVACLLQIVSTEMSSYRNYCMISMAFWHGLRVSELVSLRLEDYDPLSQRLHIRRLKGGFNTTHPLHPDSGNALQCWLQERQCWPGRDQPWLFLSRQGGKLSRQRFYQLLRTYGLAAQLPLPIHPHMLRHACGYALAERGNDTRLIQDYLGHRNIRHTVLYTASNAARFINAWASINTASPCLSRGTLPACRYR
ncbi:tyrosine-type recombinase/integrase [Citrobacter freundii]|uniref:tyrosine-type DNA invertase n=1 Tax=Klebsiella TaxID=570 RepID=UPI000907AAFC|nr:MULTISPECIES: tyrosine-type DNA invertase [Klebsiella]EGT0627989.1 tyrosine-type recombinase/integrase [Citrobacter freundii]